MQSKKSTYLCVILVIMIFLISQIGCNFSTSKKEKNQKKETLVEDFFLKPREHKIQLLAIKYQVPPEGIQYIIQDYLSSHDIIYKVMKKKIDKNNTENNATDFEKRTVVETVSMLSKKIGISEDIIASIIIDYEIWSAAEISGPVDNE